MFLYVGCPCLSLATSILTLSGLQGVSLYNHTHVRVITDDDNDNVNFYDIF